MTVTLCVFFDLSGFFSPFGMTCSFPFENHFLLFSLTPAENLLAQRKYPIQQKLLVFKSPCASKNKCSSLLLFFPSQSFDFVNLDLPSVGGERCFVFAVVSLTFQAVSPFCSLNEVEQCTANTSWFTFKKQNRKTGQKLKT